MYPSALRSRRALLGRGVFNKGRHELQANTFLGVYPGQLLNVQEAAAAAADHELHGRGSFQLFFKHRGATFWCVNAAGGRAGLVSRALRGLLALVQVECAG